MGKKLKVVICSSEVVPFAKTGGLADVAGSLPQALEKQGLEVIVIMPKYKNIDYPENLAKIGKNISVYFIENDGFFKRDGLYGDSLGDYEDNLDRFIYYSQEAIRLLKKINFKPQIIHCNDWQTALIPVYLKSIYTRDKFFKNCKTVFTIHNLGYQGLFPKEQFKKIGLGNDFFTLETLEFYGKVNVLKGGLVFSDVLTTVSENYAKEIQTPEYGCGLDGVLLYRKKVLHGIINGINYEEWNPATDKVIAKNYDPRNLEDKYINKEDLQKISGLEKRSNLPLIGLITRLADQKGLDILTRAIDEICQLPVQFILLGTGEDKYHVFFKQIAKKYPKNVSINLKFDAALAYKIYAGCDMFLMPSRYEPCGLGQLISLKYATVPLVRNTGGLADTVVDFMPYQDEGNGFVFSEYSSGTLLEMVKRAVTVYYHRSVWKKLVKRTVEDDFSWEQSARKYVELYEETIKLPS
ncbi:MAG: glycogen synthase GlgA [Candidatus Omnitrophota bacterium]